jgi:hypothetical protein
MFQVFTGDGWSDISRTLFVEAEHIDIDVALFFVTYILIVGASEGITVVKTLSAMVD